MAAERAQNRRQRWSDESTDDGELVCPHTGCTHATPVGKHMALARLHLRTHVESVRKHFSHRAELRGNCDTCRELVAKGVWTFEPGEGKLQVTTPEERARLQLLYATNPWPSRGEYEELAEAMGWTLLRVQRWFIHARRKDRQKYDRGLPKKRRPGHLNCSHTDCEFFARTPLKRQNHENSLRAHREHFAVHSADCLTCLELVAVKAWAPYRL